MAAYYRKQGKLLSDVINELYAEYGYYQNTTLNFGFEGASGMAKMQEIMSNLRDNAPETIANLKVISTSDYKLSVTKDILTGEETVINLPKSNVLQYNLSNGGTVIVRPSGTEPKIKLYLTSVGDTQEEANALTEKLIVDAKALLNI